MKIILERMRANCKLYRIFFQVIFLVAITFYCNWAIISSNRTNYSLDFRHSWRIFKIHDLHNYFDNYDNDLRKKLNLSVSLSGIFKSTENSETWNFCRQKKEEICLLTEITIKQCRLLRLFSTCFSQKDFITNALLLFLSRTSLILIMLQVFITGFKTNTIPS